MSHAAKAFEDCDRSYKAVFAQPKKPRDYTESYSNNRDGASSRHESTRTTNGLFDSPAYPPYPCKSRLLFVSVFNCILPLILHPYCSSGIVDLGQGYSSETGCRGLQVIAPAVLTQDQLWRLFDLVPGLDYCHLKSDPRSRMASIIFCHVHCLF